MDKTLDEVLEWCSEIVKSEGEIEEETLIENLKDIHDFLYGGENGNYYLISFDSFFELLNRYRDKMGEKYVLKYGLK